MHHVAKGLGLALVVCAIISSKPIRAEARKRVVVMPFKGRRATFVRAGLIKAIKRTVKLVSYKRFRAIADKLGVDGETPSGVRRVCAELKCAAVVRGRVTYARRRYRISVTVYNGATGKALGSRIATTRRRRSLGYLGLTIGRKSVRFLRKGQFAEAAPPPPSPAPKPKQPDWAKPDQPDPTSAQDAVKRPAGDDDDRSDATVKKTAASGESSWRGLFEASFGIGMSSRSYTLTTADPTQNRNYSGGVFPEFTLALEAYPLLLVSRGSLGGLGLGFSFTRHLSISSEVKDTTEEVSSGSQELKIDLRFRYFFGGMDSPMIYGLFGYGSRSFDLGANPILTSFSYQFLMFGVGGRVPLGTPLIAATASFLVRPILQVGQEAVDSFGEKDGAFAWSIRAGLSGRLGFGLTYFATFEYIGITTDFKGLDSAQVRPDTPDLDASSSGSDTFIRVWLGVGYAI